MFGRLPYIFIGIMCTMLHGMIHSDVELLNIFNICIFRARDNALMDISDVWSDIWTVHLSMQFV